MNKFCMVSDNVNCQCHEPEGYISLANHLARTPFSIFHNFPSRSTANK